ncbi:hypothetical protein K488DRAFT_54903 [Vararia minispora EC-137]|uniref:Uncharacterized protein n=1 Tax=Vararia minispora EC-137 TaxID=1314806 RepID=A0ACB8QFP7_9AGAM|nr:hypothetical protein K488DRAFT_54903 [Vararia minispora EC-137]
MAPKPIVFYDIPGNASPTKAWSPNCWKARYVLNIKGLPYRTVWLEYPDIETEMKRLSVPPTGKRDGKDLYTLPAIIDPNTGAAIADSYAIAQYLEKQYPTSGTSPLFAPNTRALQLGFRDAFDQRVRQGSLVPLQLLANTQQMNESSGVFFRRTREKMYGMTLEELAPEGPKRAALIRGVLDGLHVVGTWFDEESSGPFVTGALPCFADLELAANLLWLQIVSGEDAGSPWASVIEADGGRWARYMKEFEKWEQVN